MSHPDQVFDVPAAWAARAHMDLGGYEAALAKEASDTDGF